VRSQLPTRAKYPSVPVSRAACRGSANSWAQICAQEFAEPKQAAKLTGTDGYIARVGSWLRASF